MKKCSKCGLVKENSEFYKSKITKDGLDCYCISCKKEITAYRHKKSYVQGVVKDNRDYVESLKEPCVKCGETRRYLIQFHHVNPNEKKFVLSNCSTRSRSSISKEASKCVCLCSNCHDEFHHLYGKQPDNPVESLLNYIS